MSSLEVLLRYCLGPKPIHSFESNCLQAGSLIHAKFRISITVFLMMREERLLYDKSKKK